MWHVACDRHEHFTKEARPVSAKRIEGFAAARHMLPAAILFFLLCLCATPPALAASAAISRNTAFARETLALLNAERQKAGYSLLAEDAKLNAAAQKQLTELLRDYARNKPDSDSIKALLKKHGVSFAKAVWNNARGYANPAAAVAAFTKNKRSIVTKDEYARAGIAIGSDGKGKLYYAIIAVIPSDSVKFSGGYAAQKKRILKAVNAERRKKGLKALQYEPGLDAVATIRAKELIKKFSAERPNASNLLDLVKKNAASLASYSQTYAKTASSPDAFAAGWEKKIAEPKALEKKFTATGIGFAVNKGTLYWCMLNVEPQYFRTVTELESFRKTVLRLTNAERAKHRLAALKSDTALDKVGDARAGEIIRFYDGGHRRPDKRQWSTILAEYKISWKANGENIARGQKTPEAVVAGWMNSPGHRANILNKNFTHLGVGARMTPDGSIYWTQNFVTFATRAVK
jgi:uncharacterized protein YkwD